MATAAAASAAVKGPKEFSFAWEGKDKAGKTVRGEVRAVSESAVNATLRRQGITVQKVKKVKKALADLTGRQTRAKRAYFKTHHSVRARAKFVAAQRKALLKVKASQQQRMEIHLLVEMFRARVVDVSPATLTVEITGAPEKVDALVEVVRPYGIAEMVRTGPLAMGRGAEVTELKVQAEMAA